jgi:hypothetical protein
MSADHAAEQQYHAALRPFRRRLLQRALLQQAIDTLWPFSVVVLLVLIAARLFPLAAERALLFSVVLSWCGLQLLLPILRPRSAAADARQIDRLLGLHERIATAYAGLQQAAADTLTIRQRADALAVLAGRRPHEMQIALRLRNALIAVPLLGLVVVALLLPNPQHQVLAARAAEAARRAAAAELLTTFLAALPDEPSQQEIAAALQSVIAELNSSEPAPADLLAALTGAAADLQQGSPGSREADRLALAQLSRGLIDLAQRPPDAASVERSASQRLAQTAARLDQLDAAQQRAAAERFSQFAAETAAGPDGLSESLATAAAALNDGRSAAAAAALDEAAAAAQQAERQLAAQDQQAAALAALQQARELLTAAQPGSAPANAAAAPQAAVTAAAAVPAGSGTAAEQAPTAPAGQAAPASAAGTGSREPLRGNAAGAGPLGINSDATAPGTLRLPAAGSSPTLTAVLSAPAYQQQLRADVERAEIPANLRSIVRAYFDQLAQPAP